MCRSEAADMIWAGCPRRINQPLRVIRSGHGFQADEIAKRVSRTARCVTATERAENNFFRTRRRTRAACKSARRLPVRLAPWVIGARSAEAGSRCWRSVATDPIPNVARFTTLKVTCVGMAGDRGAPKAWDA